MENDFKVNDGGGLFDKYGMLKQIKNTLDYVADLHGWARCVSISELVRRLDVLERGLKDEDAARQKEIDELMDALERQVGKQED